MVGFTYSPIAENEVPEERRYLVLRLGPLVDAFYPPFHADPCWDVFTEV